MNPYDMTYWPPVAPYAQASAQPQRALKREAQDVDGDAFWCEATQRAAPRPYLPRAYVQRSSYVTASPQSMSFGGLTMTQPVLGGNAALQRPYANGAPPPPMPAVPQTYSTFGVPPQACVPYFAPSYIVTTHAAAPWAAHAFGVVGGMAQFPSASHQSVNMALCHLQQQGLAPYLLPAILELQQQCVAQDMWMDAVRQLGTLAVLPQSDVVLRLITLLKSTHCTAWSRVLRQAATLCDYAPAYCNLQLVFDRFASLSSAQRDHVLNAMQRVNAAFTLSPTQAEDALMLFIANAQAELSTFLDFAIPYAKLNTMPVCFGATGGAFAGDWVDIPRALLALPSAAWPTAFKQLGAVGTEGHATYGGRFVTLMLQQAPDERERTLHQIRQVVLGCSAHVHAAEVLQQLVKAPSGSRAALIASLKVMGLYALKVDRRLVLIDLLSKTPSTQWTALAEAVRKANQEDACRGNDLLRLVGEFIDIAPEDRNEMATILQELGGRWLRGSARYMVVRFLGKVPQAQRRHYAVQALRYARGGATTSAAHFRRVLELLVTASGLVGQDPTQTVSQALRLRRPATSAADCETIVITIAHLPAGQQAEFVDHLLSFGFDGTLAASAISVLRQQAVARDMLQLLRLCEPLAELDINDAWRLEMFESVITASPTARAQRLRQLIAATNPVEDEENVMCARTIGATHDLIRLFLPLVPQAVDVDAGLTDIKAFFATYFALDETVTHEERPSQPRASESERAFATRVRSNDGAREYDNVVRVIEGDFDPNTGRYVSREGDYSRPLRRSDRYTFGDSADETLPVAEILVKLWHFIAAYPGYEHNNESIEQAQANMRYGVFTALAHCVELDGHVVCGVGFLRRIMSVLQGRIAGATIDDRPTVPQAFNDACQRYFMQPVRDALGEQVLDADGLPQFEQKEVFRDRAPSGAELRAFYLEALGKAEQLYGRPQPQSDSNHLYTCFDKHALEFLHNTYVWLPSVDDADYDAN